MEESDRPNGPAALTAQKRLPGAQRGLDFSRSSKIYFFYSDSNARSSNL